jgi:hypothetical protein
MGGVDLKHPVETGNGILEPAHVVEGDPLVYEDFRVNRVEAEGVIVRFEGLLVFVEVGENESLPVPEIRTIRDQAEELVHEVEGIVKLLVIKVVIDDFFKGFRVGKSGGPVLKRIAVFPQLVLKALPPTLIVLSVIVKIPEIENTHAASPSRSGSSKPKKRGKSRQVPDRVDFQGVKPYIKYLIFNDF